MAKKRKDDKNRLRNKTVGFRVSPEEWEQFEIAVKLSGLSKQDYLIERIQQRDIVVNGNPRVYKALRNELARVLEKLETVDSPDSELLETITLISKTLDGLKNGQEKDPYLAG